MTKIVHPVAYYLAKLRRQFPHLSRPKRLILARFQKSFDEFANLRSVVGEKEFERLLDEVERLSAALIKRRRKTK